MSLLLGIFTFILVLVTLFMMLVILMQRSKSDGGVGAALGGGMAESTFGAETNSVLFNATRNGAIVFFVLSFGLYLGHLWVRNHSEEVTLGLPEVAPALSPLDQQTEEAVPGSRIEFPAVEDEVMAEGSPVLEGEASEIDAEAEAAGAVEEKTP